MGGAKAHYDCIKAFSETDFTEDLKAIDVPTLVMHGEDDQIVPFADAGPLSAKLLKTRHAEDLPGLSARHVHHARRRHQRRSAGVLQELMRGRAPRKPAPDHQTGGGLRSVNCRADASRDRAAGAALAASSFATCSGVSVQPTAPRFWRSCSSLRAPMMTLATVGRCSSQFSAICGTVLPVSLAISSSASTTLVEIFVVDLRPDVGGLVQAARFGQRLAAADLAGEAAPAERAPHHRADALVEAERHQLPFIVAPDQRIIGLMRDIARQAVAVGDGERFHQMPAGEIGAADIADLAGAHEVVERREHLLDRRLRVESRAAGTGRCGRSAAASARLDRLDQMEARGADIVGARPGAERRLGGDQHLVAAALDAPRQGLSSAAPAE